MTTNPKNPRFAYFGTGPIAKIVLEELLERNFTPALVVTAPDNPRGRGKHVSPTDVAILAENLGIPCLKPARLDEAAIARLLAEPFDVFIVADYGAILKKQVLDIPKRGTLNMHPSLLPRLRGPSPIRSAILNNDRETGVTIMVLDEEMDHGPIVAQRKIAIEPWPPRALLLEDRLAREGGVLLCEMLPLWVEGAVDAHPQNHDIATYTKKFEKTDGLLDLRGDAQENLLKIRAYEGWPTAYAFFERDGKEIRVQIIDAHVEDGDLVLDTVKPEGKGEMSFADFARSGARYLPKGA